MSNATANLQPTPVGKEGRKLNVGVKGGVHIYEGTMLSQIATTGMAVPYSTALSGPCIGVSTMEQDNSAGADGDLEVQIEWDREFVFANGTSADQVLVSTPIGTQLYGSDDHTVALTSSSGARQPIGYFCGLEPDGSVRVFVDPRLEANEPPAASTLTHVNVDIPLATIQGETSGTAFNVGAALPANARLIRSQINVLAEVSGGSISAVKAKLQGSGTAGELVGGSAGVDVFGATGPFTDIASGTELDTNRGSQQIKMTLTATSDTLNHATAGHLSVDLYYAVLA